MNAAHSEDRPSVCGRAHGQAVSVRYNQLIRQFEGGQFYSVSGRENRSVGIAYTASNKIQTEKERKKISVGLHNKRPEKVLERPVKREI